MYELQVSYGAAGTTIVPPFKDARDALLCALQMPQIDGYGHKISKVTISFISFPAAGDESKVQP